MALLMKGAIKTCRKSQYALGKESKRYTAPLCFSSPVNSGLFSREKASLLTPLFTQGTGVTSSLYSLS